MLRLGLRPSPAEGLLAIGFCVIPTMIRYGLHSLANDFDVFLITILLIYISYFIYTCQTRNKCIEENLHLKFIINIHLLPYIFRNSQAYQLVDLLYQHNKYMVGPMV